jgi:phosphocarrier protein
MSDPAELRRNVVVENKLGLHARAATKLVQLAAKYKCDVFLERDEERVNGKSIMGVLMLVAAKGTTISICTVGPDAAPALEALVALVQAKFGED